MSLLSSFSFRSIFLLLKSLLLMKPIPSEHTIDMYYNSTGISYFNISLSPNRVHHMSILDYTKLDQLKYQIDEIFTDYMNEFSIASTMNTEKACHQKMTHYCLLSILIGLFVLLMINLVYFIWNTYAIGNYKNKKQKDFDSYTYYDTIIERDNTSTQTTNPVELFADIKNTMKRALTKLGLP